MHKETFHFYIIATPVSRAIAVATEDGRTVYLGLCEGSKPFAIYQLDQRGEVMLIEKRLNQFSDTTPHIKMPDVYSIISDCQVVLSRDIVQKDRQWLEDMGLQLFFDLGSIDGVLKRLTFPSHDLHRLS